MIKAEVEIGLLLQSHMGWNIVRNVGFDFSDHFFPVKFGSFPMLLFNEF